MVVTGVREGEEVENDVDVVDRVELVELERTALKDVDVSELELELTDENPRLVVVAAVLVVDGTFVLEVVLSVVLVFSFSASVGSLGSWGTPLSAPTPSNGGTSNPA